MHAIESIEEFPPLAFRDGLDWHTSFLVLWSAGEPIDHLRAIQKLANFIVRRLIES
jgi:hypothetical protein